MGYGTNQPDQMVQFERYGYFVADRVDHAAAHRTYVEEPKKWLNLKQLAQ